VRLLCTYLAKCCNLCTFLPKCHNFCAFFKCIFLSTVLLISRQFFRFPVTYPFSAGHRCLCWYLLWRDLHGENHFNRNKAFRVPKSKNLRKGTGNKMFQSIWGDSWMAKYTKTNTQIHKYTYSFYQKVLKKSAERAHQFTRGFTRRGPRVKKIVPPSPGCSGANSDRWHSLGTPRKVFFFWTKKAEKGRKSGARPLSLCPARGILRALLNQLASCLYRGE